MDNGSESTMVPSSDPSAAAEVTPAADSEAPPPPPSPEASSPSDSPTHRKSAVVAAKPPPTPTTSHCLGARGYDGGFHDVGSFFVFRHEALGQQQLAKDGGADMELFGAAPTGRPPALATTPLQYELLEGLRVKASSSSSPPLSGGGGGGVPVVEGQEGSEVAGRAFEVLQRQVCMIARNEREK